MIEVKMFTSLRDLNLYLQKSFIIYKDLKVDNSCDEGYIYFLICDNSENEVFLGEVF